MLTPASRTRVRTRRTARVVSRGGRPLVRATYDAAQTNDDNRRHWAAADDLSAAAANSPEVRRVLRKRARYETANNSYAKGIVLTLGNHLIGTGPRLQLLTDDDGLNRRVEKRWAEWAKAVGLPAKLRTMSHAKTQDGEGFAEFIANDRLPTPVKLDLDVVEADQFATPDLSLTDETAVDGIRFDAANNPVEYHRLRHHPGDALWGGSTDYDVLDARFVLHWFRKDRPGQRRGVPDITPALPLYAELRRYTLAVVGAAETAADFTALLQSDAPAADDDLDAEPFDVLEIERRMMTTLPRGWKLAQMRAEQPTTTYPGFKREVIAEIARCLNVPYNVAAGDSSAYNYASGRLDHQVYDESIKVERGEIEAVILDPTFAAYLKEAAAMGDPDALAVLAAGTPHQWFWDGRGHVDPVKEANAQSTRLKAHTTTLAAEYARQGQDWQDALRQRGKELALMRELGLPLDGQPQADEPDEEDDEVGR